MEVSLAEFSLTNGRSWAAQRPPSQMRDLVLARPSCIRSTQSSLVASLRRSTRPPPICYKYSSLTSTLSASSETPGALHPGRLSLKPEIAPSQGRSRSVVSLFPRSVLAAQPFSHFLRVLEWILAQTLFLITDIHGSSNGSLLRIGDMLSCSSSNGSR